METPAPTPEKENAQGASVPDTVTPAPVTPEVKPEAPVPPSEDQAKVRVDEALRKVESANERMRKSVELQADLVSGNPDLIHKVFEKDPDTANQIVERLWGGEGLKSYKQLIERAKLEKVKQDTPELYETSKDVAQLKAKLEEKEKKERETATDTFLKAKGIIRNDYDPNWKKVEESLRLVNPSLVESDYGQALELAHKIAFMQGAKAGGAEVPTIKVGGGMPTAPIPDAGPVVSEQSSWLASSLNEKFGYKIDLKK